MRKIFLTISTLLTINCFGQQWADYKIDNNLTIYIPDKFTVMDTMAQHIIRAQIDNALIMIQRIPNKGEGATNIQDKEELMKTYSGFQDGIIESQKGKLKSQEWIEKDSLLLNQFSYYAKMGDENQIRHCLALFLNEHWYAIQFWEVKSMTNEMTNLRETLFSSIKVPPRQSLKNQMSYSVEGSRGYNIGFLIGKTVGYILMLGILVLLIRWISRKATRKSANAQQ